MGVGALVRDVEKGGSHVVKEELDSGVTHDGERVDAVGRDEEERGDDRVARGQVGAEGVGEGGDGGAGVHVVLREDGRIDDMKVGKVLQDACLGAVRKIKSV